MSTSKGISGYYNSLLSQHKTQAQQYFRGSNIRVMSLLPTDVDDSLPDDFDLLFISIHALYKLIDTHGPSVIQDWALDNIFIDEYHNIVGELFRYHNSWTSLRQIARFKVKVMCLSATADDILIGNLASFMGFDKFTVIGDKSTYPIPNVAINMHSNVYNHDSSLLIKSVVTHCRELCERKANRSFKIHAITMSKECALQLSNQLNNAGLPSIWLTSELHSDEKANLLKTWETGSDRVLVSTFVDGIDNSSTEDVILVGGTHSIYSLVQAVGRIRPRRQVIKHATVHIFNSNNRHLPSHDTEVKDNTSILLGAGVFPNTQDSLEYYAKMFHVSGYNSFTKQQHCLRQALFQMFDIQSIACLHCSNCKKRNHINSAGNKSLTLLSREESARNVVVQAVAEMLQYCYLCKENTCDGQKCFTDVRSRCYSCHGIASRTNFHTSADCPAKTPQINTHSQACPFCWLALSKHISCRGIQGDHRPSKCRHKNRINRVLLFRVENSQDKGVSARELLTSALADHDSWFRTMATNIASINSARK